MELLIAAMPGLFSMGVGGILAALGLLERAGTRSLPPPTSDFTALGSGPVALRGRWRLAADGWELAPLEGEAEPVRVVGPLGLSPADDGMLGEARGDLRAVDPGARHPFRDGVARRARVLVVRRTSDAHRGTLALQMRRGAESLSAAGGILATVGALTAAVGALFIR
jgi:hypothetical protein